ncbi:MAG: hypothetical protein ACYSU0_14630, partial [Planctomycetota bacterium]
IVAVLALAIWVVTPVLLLAGATMVVAARRGAKGYFQAAYIVLLGALVLGSLGISAYFGGVVRERDIAHARLYCESCVPALDQHKSQYGSYPLSLDGVARSGELPHLLTDVGFYRSDGNEFCFEFSDPGALMSSVTYHSRRRAWDTFD